MSTLATRKRYKERCKRGGKWKSKMERGEKESAHKSWEQKIVLTEIESIESADHKTWSFLFMAHTSAISSALWIWCVCKTQSYILKVFPSNTTLVKSSRELSVLSLCNQLWHTFSTQSAKKRWKQVRRTQDMKIRNYPPAETPNCNPHVTQSHSLIPISVTPLN